MTDTHQRYLEAPYDREAVAGEELERARAAGFDTVDEWHGALDADETDRAFDRMRDEQLERNDAEAWR